MMDNNTSYTTYPLQKLPISKKNEEWRNANVDFFISKSSMGIYSGHTRMEKMIRNYNLYNNKINRKDFEYVTNPFGIDEEDALPANLKNINILRGFIDLLIGEETKRPFNILCYQTNPTVINSVIEEKDEEVKAILEQIIANKVMMKYMPMIQGADDKQKLEIEQQALQEKEKQLFQVLEHHTKHNYKDELEEAANHYIKWFMQKYDLRNIFINNWKDGLISALEIGCVGELHGRTFPERVNPLSFDFDKNPDLEFIEDSNWCVRKMLMDPSTIIDRFGDIMEKKDRDSIMEGGSGGGLNSGSDVNYNYIRINDTFDPNGGFLSNLTPVYHVVWVSYVRFFYRTYTDPVTGELVTDVVAENYKKIDGDVLEEDWEIQRWEGYRINNNIYAGIRPTDYTKMPYIGIIHNNDNSEMVSFVDLMFPLLVSYLIAWYRLELTLARDKGKIINMDITQIPSSMNISTEKWLHYLSSFGVNFINPYEEGDEVKRGGHAATFNQFGSVDLTMGSVIQEYINLLDKIEYLMGDICGVSQQRKGAISNYELVSNVERSVIQSSHITEPWFYRHNKYKVNFIKAVLERSQQLWQGDDQILNYIMDDMTKVVWTMPHNFDLGEYDIFAQDSTAEARRLEALRGLSQPAMSSGASLFETAQMFITDSSKEILSKLKEIDERRQKVEQAQSEQQNQIQQMGIEAENQRTEREITAKDEISKRSSLTSIEVALINQGSKESDAETQATEKEIQHDLEIEKESTKKEKIRKDAELKQQAIDEQIRTNKKNEELKEKAINKKPVKK